MIFQQKMTLLIVSLAVFMETLDTNIINTAIPIMAQSLNVNPIDLKVALISYLLSLAIFIPISGWVADKYGAKRVFIYALAVFTLSSIWCGFVESLSSLILARVLQGLGGSFMIPLSRLLVLINFERHQFITNMNHVVIVGAIGIMLGPLLGGSITHYFSWHWIFWVNIPIGVLNLILAAYWLPYTSKKEQMPPLDITGFLLFGGGLATFTFALSAFSESNIHWHYSLLFLIAAFILLAQYAWHSRNRSHPIVNIDLFKFRTFRISILGNLFSRLSFGGVPFLLPLLLQISLHYSPQMSGLLIAPLALGLLLTKPFALKILRLFGYRRVLLINTLLVGSFLATFQFVGLTMSPYVIGMMTFVFGLLISMQYSSMNSLAYAEIESNDLSSATSIMSTTQQLSQSFGVACVAILVRLIGTKYSVELSATVFHLTFIVLGFFTMFSSIVFLRLRPEDGATMLAGKAEVHE